MVYFTSSIDLSTDCKHISHAFFPEQQVQCIENLEFFRGKTKLFPAIKCIYITNGGTGIYIENYQLGAEIGFSLKQRRGIHIEFLSPVIFPVGSFIQFEFKKGENKQEQRLKYIKYFEARSYIRIPKTLSSFLSYWLELPTIKNNLLIMKRALQKYVQKVKLARRKELNKYLIKDVCGIVLENMA